jgi:transcription elongation factor Elf1
MGNTEEVLKAMERKLPHRFKCPHCGKEIEAAAL